MFAWVSRKRSFSAVAPWVVTWSASASLIGTPSSQATVLVDRMQELS